MKSFNLIKDIFTEKFFYIFIAVVGFLSSITTMFIDINSTLSIKWFLMLIVVCLTFLLLFVRIIIGLLYIKKIDMEIKPIKHLQNDQILMVKSNTSLAMNSILSIYLKGNDYEKFIAICSVYNNQENGLVALKLLLGDLDEVNIKEILIKTTLPLEALEVLKGNNL